VFAGGIDWLYARGIRRLRSRVNILLPGAVPPEEVPHLLRLFDVLVLPHSVNAFTRAMFPEKLPEYLATGRPIVSTRLPEVVRATRGHPDTVRLADTPEGFVEACARSLEKEDPSVSAARVSLARRHTRALRLETLREALEQLFT